MDKTISLQFYHNYESLERDLNPRPTAYKAAAPTDLSYRGACFKSFTHIFHI